MASVWMSVMTAASLCMNVNYALVSSVLHAFKYQTQCQWWSTATHDIRTGDI